jgi:hypothetical protein
MARNELAVVSLLPVTMFHEMKSKHKGCECKDILKISKICSRCITELQNKSFTYASCGGRISEFGVPTQKGM